MQRALCLSNGVPEYEKALQRRTSLQATSPVTDRRYVTPPPDVMRDKAS